MDLGSFLKLLDPALVYQGGINFSMYIGATLTPIILIIALWLRISKTQLETITGSGKWGVMIKDMGIWITILGMYFGIADLLTELFNSAYSHFQNMGSYSRTMGHFNSAMADVERASDEAGFNGVSLMSAPITAFSFIFYFLSYLVVAAVVKFLSLGHALAYSFAIAWGLIAIPMSISGSIKLLRGWGVMLGTILLWPLVHYAAFAFFDPVFVQAMSGFSSSTNASIDKAQLYAIMTVVNLLTLAITLAAPFVAMALVSNSGSIAGVVTPFAAAGMAAAGAATKQSMDRFKAAPSALREGLSLAFPKYKPGSSGGGGATPRQILAEVGMGGLSGGTQASGSTSDSPVKSEINSASGSTSSSNSATESSTQNQSIATSTTNSGVNSSGTDSEPSSPSKKHSTAKKMVMASAANSSDDSVQTENTPEVAEDVAKRKQAKRGAILNQNKVRSSK